MLHGRMVLLALASVAWLTLTAPLPAYAQEEPGERPAGTEPAATGAVQTQPAGTPAPGQPADAPAAPSEAAPSADPSRVEYLAERLAADPVFISDHIPRAISAADAGRIREIIAGTGVPTYLVALPDHEGEPRGEPLLAALHERLGADGLYVYLSASGIDMDASAYAHDLPATAAARAVTFEMDHTHGPLARLGRFVEVLNSPDAEAISQAAYARSQEGGSGEPFLEPQDRAFLTGAAATGVPLAAAAAVWFVRRARRRRRSSGAAVAA